MVTDMNYQNLAIGAAAGYFLADTITKQLTTLLPVGSDGKPAIKPGNALIIGAGAFYYFAPFGDKTAYAVGACLGVYVKNSDLFGGVSA